jgi:hypothetical protein
MSKCQQNLDSYMFKGQENAVESRDYLIKNFLFGAPSHQFHLDYHLCLRWGLIVSEMDTIESDLSKGIVRLLDDLCGKRIICPTLRRQKRMPFIRFYPYIPKKESEVDNETEENS